ncbi:uncharacterized protein [Littorina saxatilis]|uniref:uncharacterized protein n=1 Tax=Littorina saxatilis TaxID=31220 RepID=UPI0038B48B59
MTMFFFLTKLGALLLVIAGKVTCADDFDLTCPSEWNDGGVEQLVCTIPLNKFSPSPSVCSFYNDTAEFKIVKGGNANLGCTVKDIDTACNNNINANGCGCQEKNATYVTLVYNIKAARNLHENSGWNCVPQCLDSSGNPAITATIASECSQINFAPGDEQDLLATQTFVFICVGCVAVFAVTVSAIVFLLKKQT